MILLQQTAEFGDGEPMSARGGEGGYPGDPTDIRKRTVGEMSEQQHFTLFFRQTGDQAGKGPRFDVAIGIGGRRHEEWDVIHRIGLPPSIPAEQVNGAAVGHGEQPRPGAPHRREPAGLLGDPDKHVLDHILGVLSGAGSPQGQTVDIGRCQIVELVEGANRPSARDRNTSSQRLSASSERLADTSAPSDHLGSAGRVIASMLDQTSWGRGFVTGDLLLSLVSSSR